MDVVKGKNQLVDVAQLKTEIHKAINEAPDTLFAEVMRKVAGILDDLPIPDARKVVFCRDCTFIDTEGCAMLGIQGDVLPNDFCSYGERREPMC